MSRRPNPISRRSRTNHSQHMKGNPPACPRAENKARQYIPEISARKKEHEIPITAINRWERDIRNTIFKKQARIVLIRMREWRGSTNKTKGNYQGKTENDRERLLDRPVLYTISCRRKKRKQRKIWAEQTSEIRTGNRAKWVYPLWKGDERTNFQSIR